MYKTSSRHKASRANSHGLNGDIAKIKAALAHATTGVKGKAGAMLSDQWNEVKDKSSDMQHNLADYIAEKPFKTLGITLLSGFIIGFLFRK